MSDTDQQVNGASDDANAFPEPPSKRRRLSHDSSAEEKFVDTPDFPQVQTPVQHDTPAESREVDDDVDASLLRVSSKPRPRALNLSSPGSGSHSPAQAALTPQDSDYTTDQASSPAPLPDKDIDQIPDPPPPQLHYRQRLILRGHKRAVAAVKFSPNGKLIASCSADATAKIWDAATGKPLHTLKGHLAGLSTLDWSPDSATLATGSDDKAIRLWSAQTGKPYPRPFLGHHNYIYSLTFSPKGNILASGSYDEAVFLWDVRSRACMRALPAHGDPVSGVDFSHDGTLIVSCASDGLVRVWDVATGQCLRTFFHEDTPAVVAVRFSPNSRFVATWMLDASVRLWNYIEPRARCVKTYQGHANRRFSLQGAFGSYVPPPPPPPALLPPPPRSPASSADELAEGMDVDAPRTPTPPPPPPAARAFLASGSEDGAIVFWDVGSKAVLQRLAGQHAGVVFGVDVHPAGRAVVSCGQDRTVRVWRDD